MRYSNLAKNGTRIVPRRAFHFKLIAIHFNIGPTQNSSTQNVTNNPISSNQYRPQRLGKRITQVDNFKGAFNHEPFEITFSQQCSQHHL